MRSKLIPPLLGYYTMAGGAEAAPIPWYLAGGVSPANCIAAYQPKGAASYAASLVNLANPGTYDCTEGVAPTWDIAGWSFDGTDDYLITGFGTSALETTQLTWAIRYSDYPDADKTIGVSNDGAKKALQIRLRNGISIVSTNHGAALVSSYSAIGERTLIISDRDIYIDGVDVGTASAADRTIFNTPYMVFGAFNNAGSISCVQIKVLASSFYKASITPEQAAAITTAMNAL